jgi:hypothetical protein
MAMKTVWFWKGPPLNSKWSVVAAYATDEHPYPSTVEEDVCPTESKAHSSCTIDKNGNLVVMLIDEQFSLVPELWYVLEETTFPTDMVALHAMTGGAFPNGTVVATGDINKFGFKVSDRVGFVKWFRKDSRLQQVSVGENWRRMRISTALISVADMVVKSGEYGPYLNGGDITTADGEELRKAWIKSTRVTPRIGSVEN